MKYASRRAPTSGEVELVGVADVATLLKVSSERVRQLAKSGGMPVPYGRLGRQYVWRLQEIESWAKEQGRLPLDGNEGRQPDRAWRQNPSGSLNLVVNEILTWEESHKRACHVRIWAPPVGSDDPHVVLLGQLQDFGGISVTNDIETVAMKVAQKYLGANWKRAQFYDYYPANSFVDSEQFHHITFAVKNYESGILSFASGRKQIDLAKALGAEFVEPSWRQSTREEIETVTGDIVDIWTPWTYTRGLFEGTAGTSDQRHEITWDPERYGDLVELLRHLHAYSNSKSSKAGSKFLDFDVDLSPRHVEVASVLVAQAAEIARTRAEEDVKTQPTDAVIWSSAPFLNDQVDFLTLAERRGLEKIVAEEVWEIISCLRAAIIKHPMESMSNKIIEQKKLLVPALRGGLVNLPWYEAGIEEPISEREGWCGIIALPSDLTDSLESKPKLEPLDQLLFLIDVLCVHLEREFREFWLDHDVPICSPSIPLSAKGPLSRTFLDRVNWKPINEIDEFRLAHLESMIDVDRVGLDPDGWLVALTKNGKEFACEWPLSGEPEPDLKMAIIRADRPDSHGGAIPVFIEWEDGRLQLLPAAGHLHHGNSFTWGYSGTGPSNLAAAVIDLLHRADPELFHTNEAVIRNQVEVLVRSPRVPNWRIDELLRGSISGVIPGTKRISSAGKNHG